ncbi:MAG: flotillin [Chloroflexi bacterium RBG_16_63_12]|nr:MAG: flotillin [Chloroflexi bacterium RBG_16_63_12]
MTGGVLIAVLAVFALFFVLLVLAFVYASRYKKVGPNEVLIISGRGVGTTDPGTGQKMRRSFRIVRGGGTFIWPVVERVDRLSLELMTIEVVTTNVYTSQGVPVTVDGVAQVKVGSDDVSIVTAAEQFLSKSTKEIQNVALQTLEGHLRGILGTLSVEEIYRDRDKFAQRVQEVSALDMKNMGLTIVSFTIKNIHDAQGYLDALGQARIAEVKRDATIGQANAQRDATIQSARARQEGEVAKFEAETKIAEAQKNFAVQKAAYDADVNQKKAESELAYTLQQNITNQKVKEQEVQISVVEKRKQIEVQEQEVARRERELEATVRKPAEAEQYRIRTLADAKKYQTETEAAGQSAATRNLGAGEADANKARGLAQADVIQAQGFAEAQATSKKAEAWQQYTQAAILQQLLDKLPELASAVAQPLAKMEKIVVINSGGDGHSGTGASRVTRDVTDTIAQLPVVIEALTGINMIDLLKNLPAVREAAKGGSEKKE